jgi:hypothetical protein
MPGTTGDIIWKKLDPKTFELYNEHPEEAPQDQQTTEEQPEPTVDPWRGRRAVPSEKEMFQRDLAIHGAEEAARRAMKHQHMRQLSDFDHELRHNPNADIQSGIQGLLDSGALRLDENGDLWSPTVKLGPHASQRILEASRIWQPPTRDPEEEMRDEPTRGSTDMSESIDSQIQQAASGIGGRPDEDEN